jgi:hypothetical protein
MSGRNVNEFVPHTIMPEASLKTLWALVPPALKAIITVCIFFVSLGWGAYGAVLLIVKAEAKTIEEKVMTVRRIDMEHMDKRFDRLEQLIKDHK